jgi:hypothetical protein
MNPAGNILLQRVFNILRRFEEKLIAILKLRTFAGEVGGMKGCGR